MKRATSCLVLVLTLSVACGFVGRGWAKSHGTPLQAELLANLKRLGIGPEALLEALATRAERTEDAGRVVVDLAVLKTLCETFGLKLEPA